MSILSRIKSILTAKANAVLTEIENPEEALELSVVEMRQKITEVKKTLVEVTTVKKRLEGELASIKDKIKLAQEQAELAIKAGRDDLAQAALEKKQDLIAQEERTLLEVEKLQEKVAVITQSKEQLEKRVSGLENKNEELIAINKAADAQLVVKEIMTGVSSDITDITERIERAENKIAEKSARISAMDELIEVGSLDDLGKTDKIDRELKAIQRQSKIKEELEALKLKTGKVVSE
ncbi:PspA/IM30 family protein [Clostridium sp. PL3]|uniref:PspA/IM30 family protein n=1 Tax=Clostridium thailandense TaxID=2794346 RepID=A0A949X455_9CLOT|nr:PspA/IM30 family protein [Clostridium thailandense]MBV7275854.1 PspA/IM30 family protein [Clostridium thailandense]